MRQAVGQGPVRLATTFLALAVGLVAGYLLGSGGAAPARAARPPSPPGIESPAAESRPASPLVSSALATLVESLPPLTVERGNGTITGRVLAADGSPIEGAVVRAQAQWPAEVQDSPLTRGEPPPVRALEDLVVERIQPLRRALASLVTARTDADGRYALSELADVPYTVYAYREGFSLEPFGRRVKPGETLDFRASPLVEVPILVLEPDGKTAASATIHVMVEGDYYARQAPWSPQAPDLPLRQGRQTIWATVGEQYDSAQTRTTIAADAPPDPLTIQLRIRAAISGRVLVPPDENPWSLEVFILRVQPGSRPDPGLLLSAGTSRSAMEKAYAFAAINLQPGTYAVGVGWSRGRIDVIEVVEVAGGTVDVDLRLPPPDPKEHALVHVLGPDGKPVAAASIHTTSRGRESGMSVRRRDGSYWVAHPREKGVRSAASECAMHVDVEGLGKKTVAYEPEAGAEMTIRFEAPARLEVVIDGFAGSGLHGHLELRPVQEDGTWLDAQGPDTDGRASFPLQPGAYELRLFSKRSGYQRALVSATALTVVPGENRVALPLPALHALTVLTRASRVNLAAADRTQSSFHTEQLAVEDGKAVFERLPAGRYRVWAGGKPVEVEVPAQLTVRVE